MINMKKNEEVIAFLNKILPNAKCELNYNKDYELLIAVMLSAQTTDKRVNEATAKLFAHYKTLEELSRADIEVIKNDIKSIGMVNVKSKNVIAIAKSLLDLYGGKVPQDKESLMSLPGVGNKTANVVQAELFNIPQFAVDTHVFRVSWRLGYTVKSDTVEKVERVLKKQFEEKDYIKLHHQFIHFGRYYCKAIHPLCEQCELKHYCVLKNKSK